VTTQGMDLGAPRQLKDAVYLQLRDDIISGALPTGAVLREAELVARFGVSKTPLRDALARLQKDGFVEIPPYRSARSTNCGNCSKARVPGKQHSTSATTR
jgi:DNA-binding GntR family transcriptional regulator